MVNCNNPVWRVRSSDGKLVNCCFKCDDPVDPDPQDPENPCTCLNRIIAEFNMTKGVSRANGVWQVEPHYSLQGYEGFAKTSPSGVIYYHEPDTTCPQYDPNQPEDWYEIFDNGLLVGQEYVDCYGVDACTAWNWLRIKCDPDPLSPDPPFVDAVMRGRPFVGDTTLGRCDISTYAVYSASPTVAAQGFEMFQFGNGGSCRHPYLGFPYYGSGDNGNTTDCAFPNDFHDICGTQKARLKATITIGDQSYPTLRIGDTFAMTTQCQSPRQGYQSPVCGSYNAGGITGGSSPFPNFPQALLGGSDDAECPRMFISTTLIFNCDGTVQWVFSGLQSLKIGDVGNNRPYRIEFQKNFGQQPGQPIKITDIWDPDAVSSSGQIPILVWRKWNGLPDTYDTVWLDWSITQE